MLGQLAFEMLEGRLPFVIRRTSDLQLKAAFWDDPEKTATGDWKSAHRAFAKIIFRMLRKDPAQRWDTFDELTKRLFNLEDENRALAKRTFDGLDGFKLKDNRLFFESFYAEYLERSGEATRKKFENVTDLPRKLMESMIAVLNFRASNEPTSLCGVVNMHRYMAITSATNWTTFAMPFSTRSAGSCRETWRPTEEKILSAWRDLFSPVIEYFKEELQESSPEANALPRISLTVPRRRRR